MSEKKEGTASGGSVKGFFLKIFIGFWVLWIIWYLTGGPYRDDKTRPFIRPNPDTGELETVGTSTLSQ